MGHKTQNNYMFIPIKVIQGILMLKKKSYSPISPPFIKADNFCLTDIKSVLTLMIAVQLFSVI